MENEEQVQKTAEELRQEAENREALQKLTGLFTEIAEELATDGEWYDARNASGLAEQCRYCERGVLDIIELVQSECKTPDDVDELLDSFKNDAWETVKFLQSQHFEHLAELVVVQYMIFCELIAAVERNK